MTFHYMITWPENIVIVLENLKSDIPMPKIECNKIVLGQMEIVKPELINLGTFQSFVPDAKIDF